MDLPAARMNTKSAVSGMPTISPTEQPRTSPPGSKGSKQMPPDPSCGRLPECSVSKARRLPLSKLEKIFEVRKHEDGTGLDCELLY